MAVILKRTLLWSVNPTATLVDTAGTGAFKTDITAAGSHDASDATLGSLSAPDDNVGFVNGKADLYFDALIVPPADPGAISFIRVKYRGSKNAGPNRIAKLQPRINGVARGSESTMSTTITNFTQDFTTDPVDSLPWTFAKLVAQTFGMRLYAESTDGAFATTCNSILYEFTIEVWGEGDITANATPATSVSGAAQLPTLAGTLDSRDPTAVVPLASQFDQESTISTVRSFKASLNDQTLATKDTFTSPSSWPNSGTQLQPLYGTASQGLQGANSINGFGTISGVKLHALVRARKNAASSITNIRFGTTMGVKALLASPTIYDFALTPTDAMFEHVETALITTGQFGQPFTWGAGVDSVWASLFGWTFNHTYSNVASDFTEIAVAEAWVEIHGPVGSTPEIISLTQIVGSHTKVVPMLGEV